MCSYVHITIEHSQVTKTNTIQFTSYSIEHKIETIYTYTNKDALCIPTKRVYFIAK